VTAQSELDLAFGEVGIRLVGLDTRLLILEDSKKTGPTTALARMFASFVFRNTTPIVVALAGSSTTQGQSASTVEKRYANILAGYVQAAYPLTSGSAQPSTRTLAQAVATPPSSPGIQFVNAGVSGTIATNYLTDATSDQLAALNPRAIFHMVGSNDFAQNVSIADYKAAIQSRINYLNSKLTVTAVHILVHSYDVTPAIQWSAYGKALQELAAANPFSIAYLDISSSYQAVGIPASDPLGFMTSDKVHQNDNGHAFMADTIRAALEVRLVGAPATVTTPPATTVTYVSDEFNRSDATTIGVADTGQTWVTTAFGITGSKAKATGNAHAFVQTGVSDMSVTAMLDTTTGTGTIGVVVNAADANNRISFYRNANNTMILAKSDTGTLTALFTSSALLADGVHKFRLTSNGALLSAYVDDVLITSYTMTAAEQTKFKAYTMAGLRASTAAGTADSFAVTKP
jgi:lysophospholipase L1-like esterase